MGLRVQVGLQQSREPVLRGGRRRRKMERRPSLRLRVRHRRLQTFRRGENYDARYLM